MRQLRTILVLCTALIGLSTLTACGFTPIYGKSANSESVRSTLAQIDIALIPDRDGQMLRNLLMDRFLELLADFVRRNKYDLPCFSPIVL